MKKLKLNGIIANNTGEIHPTLVGMMVFGEYPQEESFLHIFLNF